MAGKQHREKSNGARKADSTLFVLMDEVTIAWLAVEQRDELHDEYHMNWQTIIDSLETLTQLRISIQDLNEQGGSVRVKTTHL